MNRSADGQHNCGRLRPGGEPSFEIPSFAAIPGTRHDAQMEIYNITGWVEHPDRPFLSNNSTDIFLFPHKFCLTAISSFIIL
jgi:hypothetical protein